MLCNCFGVCVASSIKETRVLFRILNFRILMSKNDILMLVAIFLHSNNACLCSLSHTYDSYVITSDRMADKNAAETSSSSQVGDESSDATVEINIKTLDSQIFPFRVSKNVLPYNLCCSFFFN